MPALFNPNVLDLSWREILIVRPLFGVEYAQEANQPIAKSHAET